MYSNMNSGNSKSRSRNPMQKSNAKNDFKSMNRLQIKAAANIPTTSYGPPSYGPPSYGHVRYPMAGPTSEMTGYWPMMSVGGMPQQQMMPGVMGQPMAVRSDGSPVFMQQCLMPNNSPIIQQPIQLGAIQVRPRRNEQLMRGQQIPTQKQYHSFPQQQQPQYPSYSAPMMNYGAGMPVMGNPYGDSAGFIVDCPKDLKIFDGATGGTTYEYRPKSKIG